MQPLQWLPLLFFHQLFFFLQQTLYFKRKKSQLNWTKELDKLVIV